MLFRSETYSKYKNSGFKWLGKIPEHWELDRLGKKLKERKVKVSDKDYPPLSVTKQGILPQLEIAAKSNDGENRKLVRKGDFVINSRSDRKGSSGIAKTDGSVSLINIVLKLNGIFPNYCNYLLKSNSFVEEFYRMGHGIVADLWTTRYDEMKNIKIAFPPKPEQIRIANFLDRKCEQIDKAIVQKQRLIELLKERRQIIIQNAVTRGLDPNVNLKDSGVAWIGKIPEHWEVKRLKHLGEFINGYAFDSEEFKENGVKVMKISNIRTMDIDWTDDSYVDNDFYYKLPKFRINKGDLVFALTRPIISTGIKAAIVEKQEDILLNQRNAVLKPIKEDLSKWFYYILITTHFTQEFESVIDKTGQQPNISSYRIGELKVPVTDKEEQIKIVKFLDKETYKTNKAIEKNKLQIEKLKEYKSVLIDSAVTGKIKVS